MSSGKNNTNTITKNTDQVWFVTGTSSGFGKSLVSEPIKQGYKVVATVRNTDKLSDFPDDNDRVLKVVLDVTNKEQIAQAVKAANDKFGRIDVLVNNAGYGYFGSMEEADQAQVRDMMETNFWGANDMTLAVLPQMREARSGRILNVTSQGGLMTFPAFTYYHATKFAMEGLFHSLRKQVELFGIFVTNVEPGGFRTDWAGRSHFAAAETIDDYKLVHDGKAASEERSGQQAGNPELAAKAFIKVASMSNPPMHYLFGRDAYANVKAAYEETLAELETYKEDATHLGFEAGDAEYWD